MLRPIFFLFFLASCSLFKAQPSLKSRPIEELLKAVKVTGEGKGRLGLNRQSYVFNYDALLKEGKDWILAVEIPLHGEEVMVMEDLKSEVAPQSTMDSFEARINNQIGPKMRAKVLPEMRSLIRFVEAPALGLKRQCQEAGEQGFDCQLDKESFVVLITDKAIRIKKVTPGPLNLTLVAENLTASFFTKSHFTFHSETAAATTPAPLSLELFWK